MPSCSLTSARASYIKRAAKFGGLNAGAGVHFTAGWNARDGAGWVARHLKTGKLYKVIGEAVDCTNATDGRHMVIYQRDEMVFVREASEFMEKFEAVDFTKAIQQDSTPADSRTA